ncbi:acetylglutamate kinase [Bacteroides sp.]|uniref:acetylglutamate kinase n=1 Tax=Bacteroides sp. TaxID=29523 RepID=UPI002589105E|nr:acetylglutamate kinase [Bacteroides sp.]
MKEQLTIVKVGGKIVEDEKSLNNLILKFKLIPGKKILVHGGGRSATQMAEQLGIQTSMVDGRRITDREMLKVVTMVYGGLINKNIVAKLQSSGINAIGLTGADGDVMRAHKREVGDVDYGYVGDIDSVNSLLLSQLMYSELVPVMAPLTHDGRGSLLNTNADTIASSCALALTEFFQVSLIYCFEKRGVLSDASDNNSVIDKITPQLFKKLVADEVVEGGMIPKLENAFSALNKGVEKVIITSVDQLSSSGGTSIQLD